MKQHSKLSLLPEREASPGYLTNWAARLYARKMDAALKPLGLTSAHLPVVFALAGRGALSQRELVRIAAVEQPTMAATLARMERDSLVERRPDPADKRSAQVFLTPALEKSLPKIALVVAEINDRSFRGMAENDRTKFGQLLLQVISNLATEIADCV